MEVQNKKVDASPTKGFFIYMLTRDIDVRPATIVKWRKFNGGE